MMSIRPRKIFKILPKAQKKMLVVSVTSEDDNDV